MLVYINPMFIAVNRQYASPMFASERKKHLFKYEPNCSCDRSLNLLRVCGLFYIVAS